MKDLEKNVVIATYYGKRLVTIEQLFVYALAIGLVVVSTYLCKLGCQIILEMLKMLTFILIPMNLWEPFVDAF